MQSPTALVSFANGRFDLVIPPAGDCPPLTITSARAGLAPANGAPSFSSEWQTLSEQPVAGEDRCGRYEGLQVTFGCGASGFQAHWQSVVYLGQPLAAQPAMASPRTDTISVCVNVPAPPAGKVSVPLARLIVTE